MSVVTATKVGNSVDSLTGQFQSLSLIVDPNQEEEKKGEIGSGLLGAMSAPKMSGSKENISGSRKNPQYFSELFEARA